MVLSQLLRPYYRVRAINSGHRCLEAVAPPHTPDLILLDVMMPGIDGYQVLSQLRSNSETRDIPVIFVTALDDDTDEAHGLSLGADDYISKPIRPEIVLARVRTQLELKSSRDRLKNQNAWLESEVARRIDEVLAVQDVGIHALAELAETRDPETGNHIKRTQQYVDTLARQLKNHSKFKDVLTDPYINLLTKSAPLHDIGKVGIPDAILLKPGPLSPDEWAMMQTHSALGASAIEKAVFDTGRPIPFLGIAKEIALWHHEKWDGSGYPDGLSGDSIPLAARLMALADVFDALVSRRVYKPAFSYEKARKIIMQDSGIHFDPEIVNAFSACYDDFVAIASEYADIEVAV